MAAPDAEGVRPVSAVLAQGGSLRGTELRPGEALVLTGIASGSPRSETATLLVVTPELTSKHGSESATPLVPAPRGRKAASRRSADHSLAEESHQRSLDFYISGPVGYSE